MKGGGKVENGRVNGNLNLSRSLGDFMYKLNKDLPYNQQIISFEAVVKTVTR